MSWPLSLAVQKGMQMFIVVSDDLSFFLTTCLSLSGSPQVLSPSMSGPPNVQPRRSSRLFTSASSTAKVLHPYCTPTVLLY